MRCETMFRFLLAVEAAEMGDVALIKEEMDFALARRWLLDPDGDRHAETGHPVENLAANLRLGPLVGQGPGVEASADIGFISEHGGSTRLRRP